MKIFFRKVVCFTLFLGLLAGCAGNNAGVPDTDSQKAASVYGFIYLNNTGTYTYLPWNASCSSSILEGEDPHAFYVLKTSDGASVIDYIGDYNDDYPSYSQTITPDYPPGFYRLYVYQESIVSGLGYVDAGSDWCYVIDTTN